MVKKINTIIITFILTTITSFMIFQTPVYAKEEESTWINDAFAAARKFLSDSNTEVSEEGELIVYNAKMLIRGINRILWVLLGGISAISLAIVGIRYILGINSSEQRGEAKKALHQTIFGMVIGFSAILIFNIAMIFVRLIINSM